MADINTNQHGPFLSQGVRELHLEEISANLAVDLSQDVSCFRKIKRSSVPDCDDLRRHGVGLEHFFVSRVVVLITKNSHANSWVDEDTVRSTSHVLSQLVLELFLIVFTVHLNKMRLLNFNSELLTSVTHRVIDFVGNLVVGTLFGMLVDHDPLILQQ